MTTTTTDPAAPTTEPVIDAPAGSETTAGTSAETTAGTGDETTAGSGADALGGETTAGNETTAGSETTSGAGNDTLSPASYDSMTLPEGFTVDPDSMATFKTLAAESKLPPEAAQKYIDLFSGALKKQAEANHTLFTSTQDTWKAEVKELPEYKANPDAALATMAKVLDEFGSPEVREIMDITGAGNNPHMVAMLLKLGKALEEGKPTPLGAPSKSNGTKTPGQVLYPTPTT